MLSIRSRENVERSANQTGADWELRGPTLKVQGLGKICLASTDEEDVVGSVPGADEGEWI